MLRRRVPSLFGALSRAWPVPAERRSVIVSEGWEALQDVPCLLAYPILAVTTFLALSGRVVQTTDADVSGANTGVRTCPGGANTGVQRKKVSQQTHLVGGLVMVVQR